MLVKGASVGYRTLCLLFAISYFNVWSATETACRTISLLSVSLWYPRGPCFSRADSRFAPSQWETALLCNTVFHWLGASLESALYPYGAVLYKSEWRLHAKTLLRELWRCVTSCTTSTGGHWTEISPTDEVICHRKIDSRDQHFWKYSSFNYLKVRNYNS